MTSSHIQEQQCVVLIVDDAPENLSALHDILVDAGYVVIIATNGADALMRAKNIQPNVLLLDAIMPGMDGFEVCEKLKADFLTQHIPVIFMTGLTETEYVLKGFQAGGVDYVTKPIRPEEVIARIQTHVSNSRMMTQARDALDLSGQAVFAVSVSKDQIVWQTPLARKLLEKYCVEDQYLLEQFIPPEKIKLWLEKLNQYPQLNESPALYLSLGQDRLLLKATNLAEDEQLMIALREESVEEEIQHLMKMLNLTRKEAEVMHWVIQGKANKDIADILQISPRTVNKHLEHVFEKLGVDSRTGALAYVRNKL